jgi:hypothetical protein
MSGIYQGYIDLFAFVSLKYRVEEKSEALPVTDREGL